MGLTYITTKVINPKKQDKTFTRRFLVDTGAIYSVIDHKILEELQIQPTKEKKFILANGQEMTRKLGEATFELKGEKATSPIVFGDDGIFLLGAVTLETFGVIVDPISRQVRGLPMLI